jgi:hypothetical protein
MKRLLLMATIVTGMFAAPLHASGQLMYFAINPATGCPDLIKEDNVVMSGGGTATFVALSYSKTGGADKTGGMIGRPDAKFRIGFSPLVGAQWNVSTNGKLALPTISYYAPHDKQWRYFILVDGCFAGMLEGHMRVGSYADGQSYAGRSRILEQSVWDWYIAVSKYFFG